MGLKTICAITVLEIKGECRVTLALWSRAQFAAGKSQVLKCHVTLKVYNYHVKACHINQQFIVYTEFIAA